MTERVDVAVAGGGPAGMAAALALAAHGREVALIDPHPAPIADPRPIALADGSRLILERLGAWEGLAPATPIQTIHVSQRGAFGRAVLTAAEARVPALGYVVDYGGVAEILAHALAASRVRTLRATRVASIEHVDDAARLVCAGAASEMEARLVIVADGGAISGVTGAHVRDYRQTAITARVSTTRPHRNVAYERFTSSGPLALLPFGDGYALVWSVRADEAEALSHASDAAFLTCLQERFGERVGRFIAVSERSAHALSLRVADGVLRSDRIVLIGNAAQAVHPVAGQGLNLALRDAWELARAVGDSRTHVEAVAAFRARRLVDRTATITFTDALATLFAIDFPPLAIARGAGLALVDNFPPVKDFLVRRMMFGARG